MIDRFFGLLSDGVHSFEGSVDQFTGDGVMALFGAPIAHEDHAAACVLRRACSCNWSWPSSPPRCGARTGSSFAVRIGLNSGEVVVGSIGEDLDMEYTAIGHTVGLAKRMEQLAEPGKVYVSEYTAALVDGYVRLRDLGRFTVDGVTKRLGVSELLGSRSGRGRLDVAPEHGSSRLVGREDELAQLEQALSPTSGRSSASSARPGSARAACAGSSPAAAGPPARPSTTCGARRTPNRCRCCPCCRDCDACSEIGERDSDERARERIATKMLALGESFDQDLPLLFDFLGVPDPERTPTQLDPEARQRQLLELMNRLSHAQSAHEPGVLLVEDLHWLDSASDAFLANQVEVAQGTGTLMILNFRPDYHAPWMGRSYYRQIALAPLGGGGHRRDAAVAAGRRPVAGRGDPAGGDTRPGQPVLHRGAGALAGRRGQLEGDRGAYRLAAPVDEDAVPPTVQAVLAARIDRLPQRAEAGAARRRGDRQGGPARVLSAVVDLEPGELEEVIALLVAGEFIYSQQPYPEPVYVFTHPLTQEVAYRSQLRERRAPIHAAVARAIIEHHPQRLDERAASLAQHWESAGETLEAARWHSRAAAWAGSTDPAPALRHWQRAGELAEALPESQESTALVLAAGTFSLLFGWRVGISHEEAEAVFTETERLASETGDTRARAVLFAIYALIRGLNEGDLHAYGELAGQAVDLAEEYGDPELYMSIAPLAYGFLASGDYARGMAICDRAMELTGGDAALGAGILLRCPYAMCLAFKGAFTLDMGDLEEAGRLIDQGRELAREHDDVEGVGLTHSLSTRVAYFGGRPEAAMAHARQAVEIAEQIGSSQSRARAWLSLGLAERMRGQWKPAIEALERSLDIARAQRAGVDVDGWRLALLGESYLGLGDHERALEVVEEGVTIARAQGSVFNEIYANVALARILLAGARADAAGAVEEALDRAEDLVGAAGAATFQPLIDDERAELARVAA